MSRQGDLFGGKPKRVLMHAVDAGYSDGYHIPLTGAVVKMRCGRCGHGTGWVPEEPGDVRGRPCPKCNRME